MYLWPQTATWWFLPGFAAVALSWEVTLQIWSIFDRREADLYGYWSGLGVTMRFSSGPADIDARGLLRWMGLGVVVVVGIPTVLALSMHAALRSDGIRECGYAVASCKDFEYNEASRMTIIDGFRTTDGKFTRRAGSVIDFVDGRRWSSAD
jgi:hypothetical protein